MCVEGEYNVLEHLGRSVSGASYLPDMLFTMLASYFDEAISEDRGFITVCGWAATIAQWQQFEYDWRLFLAKYDVPYFHMLEYAHSKGPFKKWHGKKWEGTRKNFMRDAATIVSETAQRGFIAFVDNEIFETYDKAYELRSRFNSPYALAGRSCVAMANTWQRTTASGQLEMKYVFEDGGPDKGGLISAMQALPPHLPAPIFEPGHDSKASKKWPNGRKGLVQLQAADYLAYEIRKFVVDHPLIKAGTRGFRASLGALPNEKIDKAFITGAKLEQLCKLANIKRR